MKIGVAQIRPIEGDVEKNIQLHLGLIHLAITAKTDAMTKGSLLFKQLRTNMKSPPELALQVLAKMACIFP